MSKRPEQSAPAYLLAKLEQRIRQAGGTPPKPWPWADKDPLIRHLQLLEYAETLEQENV